MSKKKAEREDRIFLIENARQLIETIIRWGVGAFAIWAINDSVRALAGQTTDANFNILSEFTISEAFAYLLGGGSFVYARREVSLRKAAEIELEKLRESQRQDKPGA